MKKLLGYADDFLIEANWKDLALMKICLCAAGVLLGLSVPKEARKMVAAGAITAFAATYTPVMLKFLDIVSRTKEKS